MTTISPSHALSINLDYVGNTQELAPQGEPSDPSQLSNNEHVNGTQERANFFQRLKLNSPTSPISTNSTKGVSRKLRDIDDYDRSTRVISELLANELPGRLVSSWDTSFLSDTEKYSKDNGFSAKGLYAFAYQLLRGGLAQFAFGEKAAFLVSEFHLCKDFKEFLAKAAAGRKLQPGISQNLAKGPYTLLLKEDRVRRLIFEHPLPFHLGKNLSQESIDKVISDLLTKNLEGEHGGPGGIDGVPDGNIDWEESTGVLLEYGEENSMKSLEAGYLRVEILRRTNGDWKQGAVDDVFEKEPQIRKAFRGLGELNIARTLCQINDCMKPDDVKPMWFRMWDSPETEDLAEKDMAWVTGFNEKMRAESEVEKEKERNPDLPYIDFLIDAALDAMYEK